VRCDEPAGRAAQILAVAIPACRSIETAAHQSNRPRKMQATAQATARELNAIRKRSVIVHKRRTSISLEDSFWDSLHAIVRNENVTIGDFIEKISRQRASPNLSSNLRVAVLEYYKHLAVSTMVVGGDPARQGEQIGRLATVANSRTGADRRNPSDLDEAAAGGLPAVQETDR
jgi:predicted DNA-binding ribbon-helix-helix protein